MNLFILIFALCLGSPVYAADTPETKEGAMMIIARMMHCNDLAAKPVAGVEARKKLDEELLKYRCATVSCDLMKIVDTHFPAAKESAETRAQMAMLGVCK